MTSEFSLDDKRFLGKIPPQPDPELRAAFFAADKEAQGLAQSQLNTDSDDPNALFAMSLSLGMQAEYASLIDKRQIDSLGGLTRLKQQLRVAHRDRKVCKCPESGSLRWRPQKRVTTWRSRRRIGR